ncbi:MAG TPA: glycosyltransferase family 2 protein [Gaiellaceae bacterium]|nr:glycosyltransferase family 2 protein [Gaiellaceae bacterium]
MLDDDDRRYAAAAAAAGVPYLALDPASGRDPVDRSAATLVPAELGRMLGFVPVRADREGVTLAVDDPARAGPVEAVRGLTGLDVSVVVSPPRQIARAQERVFGPAPVHVRSRYLPPEPPQDVDPAFLRRLAEAAGVPYSDLAAEGEVDPDAARLVGERTSRRLRIVALRTEGDRIHVATAQPFDTRAAATIEAIAGRTPVPVVAPPARIAAAIDAVFGPGIELAAARTLESPRSRQPGERLGELLVRAGKLDAASVRAALAQQRRTGDRLGHIMLSLGYLQPEALAETIATQLRLPYVEPRRVRIRDGAAALLPESLCRRHRLLPLEALDGQLVVAMADPLDPEASRALAASTPLPVRVVVASDATIAAGLERAYAAHYTELSTTQLIRRRPDESAHEVLTAAQRLVLAVLLAATALGLVAATVATVILLVLLSIVFYTSISLYKFVLIYRTIGHEPELPVSDTEVELLDAKLLPRYTILVPLYDEAAVLPGLVRGLDQLDYPKTKLDIKLLLEADDQATIRAARRLALGSHYDLVIVPRSEPRTKPKACNYGLLHARGEYVVIFDAEDRPEPDQLKKAVVAFRKAPPGVACVQAKLNYWNREQNLLTRWFTIEYSQWFDLFLPGLDATGAPIPLGGTSNHFPVETLLELGAWDPFNVTEDADVGIRLSRRGLRTAMIDSTTYEEANSRLYNWIRQRSRWVKGYIQTWLVHMRHPVRLWRELGTANFLSFQLVVGGTFLTMLLNPLFWGLTTLWALTEAGFIRQIFPGLVYFAGSFNLLIGNFVFTYLNVAGTIRRGYSELVKYALFSPLYWALMSVGAWKGFFQLLTRPSYWEKTVHGLTAEDE